MSLIRKTQPLASIRVVPGWWTDLYRMSPEATVFMSPQWVQTWLNVYGQPFSGEWLCWQANEQVVGGVLVLWRTIWSKGVPLRTCTLNASGSTRQRSPDTEFNQVLHLAQYDDAITTDLAAYLQAQRWDRLELAGYEQTPFFESLIGKINCAKLETDIKPAPYVNLDHLQTQSFEDSLNSKSRLHVRQSIARYEQVYGALTLDEAHDDATRQQYLQALAKLHNAAWEVRGISGSFACEAFTGFHQTVVQLLGQMQEVKLMRICAAGQPIGYLYAFVHRGRVYLYQSGFRYEQDTKLRPGLVSHALAVRHCVAQGLNEYNLMAGESQYKRALARERRTVCWTTLYRNTLASRAFLGLRDAKRYFKPIEASAASVQS